MCIEEQIVGHTPGPSVLGFEARWLKEKNFMDIVEGGWELAGPLNSNDSMAGRLARVHAQLH